MLIVQRPAWIRYGVAALLTAAALATKLLLIPLATQDEPVLLFLATVNPEIWLALAKWARSTQSLTVIQRKVAETLGKQASTTGKFNRRLANEGGLLLAKAIRLGWIRAKLSRGLVEKLQMVTAK